MIVILDYGMGNSMSIVNMLRYLKYDSQVSNSIDDIRNASGIILPGVGSFDNAIRKINPYKNVLQQVILENKIPYLGICLGMQILFESSEEGEESGFGWLKGSLSKFSEKEVKNILDFKVPHMGWNKVTDVVKNDLGIENNDLFYFAHSYYVSVKEDCVLAKCNYGNKFPCVVSKKNLYGVQFHPEKSHKYGMKVLDKFAKIVYG